MVPSKNVYLISEIIHDSKLDELALKAVMRFHIMSRSGVTPLEVITTIITPIQLENTHHGFMYVSNNAYDRYMGREYDRNM